MQILYWMRLWTEEDGRLEGRGEIKTSGREKFHFYSLDTRRIIVTLSPPDHPGTEIGIVRHIPLDLIEGQILREEK